MKWIIPSILGSRIGYISTPPTSSWQFSRTITIDMPGSDLTDFPLLFSGSYSYLKTTGNGGNVTNSNGYDIAFFNDSNLTNMLKFERVNYNSSSGEVEFWIKIPTLSSSTNTVIYLGYNNSGISSDQQDAPNVWTNEYRGVWHLSNGTNLNVSSSTGTNHASINGTVTAVSGTINGAAKISGGSTNYINAGSDSSLSPTQSLTLSCWVNIESDLVSQIYHTLISRWQGTAHPYIFLIDKNSTGGTLYLVLNNGAATISGSTDLNGSGWKYLTATYDKTNIKLYVNGISDTNPVSYTSNLESNNTTNVIFGTNPEGPSGRTMNGRIDEIRISSIARSVDWIQAEYSNQNDPASFYIIS